MYLIMTVMMLMMIMMMLVLVLCYVSFKVNDVFKKLDMIKASSSSQTEIKRQQGRWRVM